MSNTFKIGDRVRYKVEMVEQGFLHPRKLGLTGKILRLQQGQGKCYLVKWNDVADSETTVHGSWLESVPPSGRTFEEICKELAENTAISAEFRPVEVWSNRDEPFTFITDYCGDEGWEPLVIHRDGRAEINVTLSAAQLAAIAAACTEIADNYEAEHGKEEA